MSGIFRNLIPGSNIWEVDLRYSDEWNHSLRIWENGAMKKRRWRTAILVESTSKEHPEEFKRKWDLFFRAINDSGNYAFVEGSTGVLRHDPDVYRAEVVFYAEDDRAANEQATKLAGAAATAAGMPQDWSRVVTVYEWPEGFPLR